MDRAMIISSDGHAMANMRDYRPYLPASAHEEFDEFCDAYDQFGFPSTDPRNLGNRVGPDDLDAWIHAMLETDRVAGRSDPVRRLEIMEQEGIVAEILFPDFGLPFELYTPMFAFMGDTGRYKPKPRTREQVDVGYRAHNRWLLDFCSIAPERFGPMALVLWDNVPAAVAEIVWAKDVGFRGVLVPTFDVDAPLFDPKFEPIWNTLEELEMPANVHVSISSTVPVAPRYKNAPPEVAFSLNGSLVMYHCHEVLTHLIWSGLLERHPGLRVCFTEVGSGWLPGAVRWMDYTWGGSYLRRDSHRVVPRPPSEYVDEQCFLGSSIFSRTEIEARHDIGLDKMLLGMDYPHHEGTFAPPGTLKYLQGTLGQAQVPRGEAQRLLGENHVERWGFDGQKLRAIADRIGPNWDDILRAPTDDPFPRGDVNRPLAR